MVRCGSTKCLLLGLLFFIPGPAFAGPGLIQYQGRLTDAAGNPITTPVSVTFTFWSAATGGTQLGGGYFDTDGVTPNSQGLYSTMIGDESGTKIPDSVFASPQVWLNINVGGENLTPRKQLAAVAYAFQSNWATTATTAVASKDTLASVAGRGASTSNQLTLTGGVKTGTILALSSIGSVLVEDVGVSNGIIKLPSVVPPSDFTSKLYQSGQALYWSGIPVMISRGAAYLYVTTTADPVTNGLYLKMTYDYAKALRPYGQDLSTTNRLTILILPGRYDLTGLTLNLDTQYIDLVGLSTASKDQYIYGNLTTGGTGLLNQAANDVRIENLYCMGIAPASLAANSPFTYKPDSGTTKTVVRNCEFQGQGPCLPTAKSVNYPGRYENCTVGSTSFGYLGDASGTFVNCTAGDGSFGSNGKASGTFIDCKAGNHSFGYNAVVSGTFNRCTAKNYSFGYYGTVSGTFVDCTGGDNCFGFGNTASGTFERCIAGQSGFGVYGTASGKFTNCSASNYSFGTFGTASGTFIDCAGASYCFGYIGTASGLFKNCNAYGYSFGSGSSSKAGVASGTFINCSATAYSFGSSPSSTAPASTMSGTFTHCVGSYYSFGAYTANNFGAKLRFCQNMSSWTGTWAGHMDNCYWERGFTCAETARVLGTTVAGTINLNHTKAGVGQCRAQSILYAENNVYGATTAAAMNLVDPDVE